MQEINIGTSNNSKNGDTIRGAFIKVKNNFNELDQNKLNIQDAEQGISTKEIIMGIPSSVLRIRICVRSQMIAIDKELHESGFNELESVGWENVTGFQL